MGSPTLEKIRSEALSLPESDRAELAHSLVISLDGLAEIDSGTANLIDRDEFRRRMRARLSRS